MAPIDASIEITRSASFGTTITSPTSKTSDEAFLNSKNLHPEIPSSSDVVVVGGGIHSLIYAIHTHLRSRSLSAADSSASVPSITILERLSSPGYKIGESTLTTFGVWLKTVGISTSVLWRLFGAKDGLAFYYLPEDGSWDGVTSFCANGPRGDFVATLQIERKISELLLTLYAQRLGVKVLHGVDVDVAATETGPNNGNQNSLGTAHLSVVKLTGGKEIETKLLVDATGRFRRFSSKASRTERFEGINTDSFWAYFEMDGDESELPFENYESCHTNHVCLAEGWAWLIRLPTWENSPIQNLVPMINHLLDLNDANAHSDAYPSMQQLTKQFGCKVRWVTSIGYALRRDVLYPPGEELEKYGSCEAERKFRWITAKYPRMQAYMDRHRLIRDLYGPSSTWFIRKQLSYISPVVAGMAPAGDGLAGMTWAAIGDAAGFTNPLYSPGINCNMATSILLAEKTLSLLTSDLRTRQDILKHYNKFCSDRVANLHRMNVFNYVLMRSPRTGPLGPLWQYLSGTGNARWQRAAEFVSIERVADFVTTWEWGSQHPEYIAFAQQVIRLLSGPLQDGPPEEAKIEEVLWLSQTMLTDVKMGGRYHNRWAGLFSYYNNELQLAVRCEGCGNWRILTGDSRRCCVCGFACKEVNITKYEELLEATAGGNT
ncbi:hypothetical protein B0I35DRAFT_453111 [Stachybotrys elegans]|uniref:FAD-binding domain-containing protein n=1 Tax=Stachybotrys elegans TaxID=80388 RepID=A0A8K0SKJ2_9HYPO|nr:hypothetical protein B0I35DRAFT_453111 [Stachybotrys elegans]